VSTIVTRWLLRPTRAERPAIKARMKDFMDEGAKVVFGREGDVESQLLWIISSPPKADFPNTKLVNK